MILGILGYGTIGTIVSEKAIHAGHDVILSNSRGPESLKETIDLLGPHAAAGTVLEASRQQIVLLAVPWTRIQEAVAGLPDWGNRIVIDATNAAIPTADGYEIANVEPLTASEVVASLLPGARVVKAFNSMYGEFIDGEVDGGRRVLFYAGDDAGAKATVGKLFEQMGFYPHDLGSLAVGGRIMQIGGPLSAAHFIHREGE